MGGHLISVDAYRMVEEVAFWGISANLGSSATGLLVYGRRFPGVFGGFVVWECQGSDFYGGAGAFLGVLVQFRLVLTRWVGNFQGFG